MMGALGSSPRPKLVDLRQTDIPDLNILVAPLVEQLDAADLVCHLLGQDLVARGGVLHLDLAGVRHGCCFHSLAVVLLIQCRSGGTAAQALAFVAALDSEVDSREIRSL